MKTRLLILNLLLLAALTLLGRELHKNWQSARERERKTLQRPVPAAKPDQLAAIPAPPAIQAVGYNDVAQQTLFSKDRNPNVVEEPPPPPPPPPPFPRMYGVLNLGDGLEAILSEGPGRRKPFRVGDNIGELKLTEIGSDYLAFEWKDKKFNKKFAELMDRNAPQEQEAPARTPSTAPPPPVTPAAPVSPTKGTEIGGGVTACVAGDNSPAGTVQDGKRKVVSETPFGKVCRWEPVK